MSNVLPGDVIPFSHLTDEDLLRRVYAEKETLSALAIELAARLEHALDELHPNDDIETVLRKRSRK